MYDTHYTDALLSHIAVQWFKAQVFTKGFSNFQASDNTKDITERDNSDIRTDIFLGGSIVSIFII